MSWRMKYASPWMSMHFKRQSTSAHFYICERTLWLRMNPSNVFYPFSTPQVDTLLCNMCCNTFLLDLCLWNGRKNIQGINQVISAHGFFSSACVSLTRWISVSISVSSGSLKGISTTAQSHGRPAKPLIILMPASARASTLYLQYKWVVECFQSHHRSVSQPDASYAWQARALKPYPPSSRATILVAQGLWAASSTILDPRVW